MATRYLTLLVLLMAASSHAAPSVNSTDEEEAATTLSPTTEIEDLTTTDKSDVTEDAPTTPDAETTTILPAQTSPPTTPAAPTTPTAPTTKRPHLPRRMKVCAADDPKLNECFKDSANKMLKYILPGVRRLGLVRMEPLRVPLVALPRGNAVLPALAFNATDSEQFGWRDAVFTDASVDLKGLTFSCELFFPSVLMRGHYEVDGEFLGFIPLNGAGTYNIKTAKLTNSLLNQNSALVKEQASPVADAVFSQLYQGLIQRFFDAVPLEDLFPGISL